MDAERKIKKLLEISKRTAALGKQEAATETAEIAFVLAMRQENAIDILDRLFPRMPEVDHTLDLDN